MDDSSASSGLGYERAYHHHAHNGNLILISLAVLFFICIFIALFHWYAQRLHDIRRRYLNRVRSDYYLRRLVLPADNIILDYATSNKGLECCVLISLPTFQYDSAVNGGAPSECAVCLSEFQEGELCRTLPACNHAFHVDCIDMWFHSQSNCPICRAEVQPVKKPIQSTTPIAERLGQ